MCVSSRQLAGKNATPCLRLAERQSLARSGRRPNLDRAGTLDVLVLAVGRAGAVASAVAGSAG